MCAKPVATPSRAVKIAPTSTLKKLKPCVAAAVPKPKPSTATVSSTTSTPIKSPEHKRLKGHEVGGAPVARSLEGELDKAVTCSPTAGGAVKVEPVSVARLICDVVLGMFYI